MVIVEDNEELREFLVGAFKAQYDVEEAIDGMDGMKKATSNIPDIIISDIIMPRKDGIEMCKEIRDEIPNYIPIILLTAKTFDSSKYEGIEAGADVYITKPFSIKFLELRVKKLLESRRKLRDYFNSSDSINIDSLNFSSVDEKFLHKVIGFIEDNIGNSEFNVSELANSMSMSRSHLYRRIKSLTGQIPNNFIKSVRLNYAASLLKKKKYTVSEISFHVGFNDPKYFSRCFRKKFNVSPTAYPQSETETI